MLEHDEALEVAYEAPPQNRQPADSLDPRADACQSTARRFSNVAQCIAYAAWN